MNHGDCFLLKWHETAIKWWYHWRYTMVYLFSGEACVGWPSPDQVVSEYSRVYVWIPETGNGKLGWFGCTQQPNGRMGWWWGKCLDWADPIILFMTGIPKIHQKKVEPDKADKAEACKNMLLFPSGYFNVWNISLEKLLLQIPRQYPRPLEIKRALGNGVPPGHAGGILWSHQLKIQEQNHFGESCGVSNPHHVFPGETLW